ncbi:hypothetical protein M569_12612, partial [Genlisea aurea]
MECNRDEAKRAKSIAERKIESNDFTAARKFAMKARALYPDLDGLSQMLKTIDVYISAENKVVSGEVDWYGVLEVSPSADEETIRRQYRKLALALHPDKNTSVGADGAFNLISEAWNLLSDKASRLAYNQRRGLKVYHQKANSVFNSSSRTASRTDTFWTICHQCKMNYEYLRVYLDQMLLCPNCRGAFMATETPSPYNLPRPPPAQVPRQQHCNVTDYAAGRNACSFGKNVQKSVQQQDRPPVPAVETDHCAFPEAVNVIQDKRKRAHNEKSGRPVELENGFSGTGSVAFRPEKNVVRDLTSSESRNMLMGKGLSEIRNKLKGLTESGNKVVAKRRKKAMGSRGNETTAVDRSRRSGNSSDRSSMNVPDADFHDFDLDRTEASFGDNEVWAGYDDDDGMPRFYALVSRVISRKPFKLRISWLNPLRSGDEFGSSSLDWIGSGFYKTCGEFRVGRYETCSSINAFSQKVGFARSPRGGILVYPQKDDVWALYKNWSSDWDEGTPDDVVHKYEMAVVVEGYDPDRGAVVVAPLEKADGFRTVYRRDDAGGRGTTTRRRIPTEEMFRFSHRVPYYALTGSEAENVPEGWLELDTAATPSDLLQ